MADTAITPTTGSIAFTGDDVYFINSGDSKLVFTGNVPVAVLADTIVKPSTGTLTFVEQTPRRRTGLDFTGYAPTIAYSWNTPTGSGSISITGKVPLVVEQAPPNKTVRPDTKELTFTGTESAVLVQKITPATASLAFSSDAPNATIASVTAPVYPFFDILRFTGYAPTINVANSGTSITNQWATDDVESNYQIDDRTGFKIKVKDPMVEEYTGHMVRPESLDKRSEQEFIRSKPENQKGPTRPEPVGSERFIEDEYPNGVDADDL